MHQTLVFIQKHKMQVSLLAFMAVMVLAAVPASFAQTTPIPTLAIESDVMASQMMTGANIIVGAIGVVIFLLIGMKLGGVIIRAISSAIDGLRI